MSCRDFWTRELNSAIISHLASRIPDLASRLESAAAWLPCEREAAFDRRALLRLPVVFRDSKPLQFPGRTNQCHFRFYENAPSHDQTSPAGTGRGVLG